MQLTSAEKQNLDKWLKTRPKNVQAFAKLYPMDRCYRYEDGHYWINAYTEMEDGTIKLVLAHGSDSFAPGITVFGIDPLEVEECNCGHWQPPTDEDIAMKTFKMVMVKVQYIYDHLGEMDDELKQFHRTTLIEMIDRMLAQK